MTETRHSASADGTAVFALRQGALMALALLVGGLVTERLRPDEALDRGIVATPFLWAIVVWCVVLAVNALAFDDSQMQSLEGTPLIASVMVGAIVLVVGVVSYHEGSFGPRLVYLFANSVGAIMFWWAVISLGFLAIRRIASSTE